MTSITTSGILCVRSAGKRHLIGALSFLLSRHRSVADSLIISSGDGRHFVVIILFDLNYVNMTLSKNTGVKMGDNVGISLADLGGA